MAAKLIVTKATGELLFDTTKISYGFVKSGYMVYIDRWMRYRKPFTNTDPDAGSSWTPMAAGDAIHGFSVSNARSPIVFIVGSGTLTGTSISGGVTTFLYTNASTNTKCYVFDLMSDDIPGGPYLKTWNTEGQITFNSLQRPLNIVASIKPPGIGPAVGDGYGGYFNCYNGGYTTFVSDLSIPQAASYLCAIAIQITPGVEYAAYLPWSRACRCDFVFNTGGPTYFGASEGAYGGVGGISFIFGPSGATLNGSFTFGPGYRATARWQNIPTDRLPEALVIETSKYPFPYG